VPDCSAGVIDQSFSSLTDKSVQTVRASRRPIAIMILPRAIHAPPAQTTPATSRYLTHQNFPERTADPSLAGV